MAYCLKYWIFIAWLVILYATGIFIFTRGFLLTRFVINNNHSCDLKDTFSSPYTHGYQQPKQQNSCWMPARYQRAIVLIIDALRFDFAYFNHSIPQSDLLMYQNKLKIIDQLIRNFPQKSALYHFIADPPTTTLQRLKGLTTGSLPTFADVASNFDSSSISEDNIIQQLVQQNKSVVFMGDDTWISLFPDIFKRQYAFPSFNVKDLHTVDNGILEHLHPELEKNDWDVLIAHFLGVDHCGHRYGPNHPAMAEKLQQMDDTIKSVVNMMDESTVLFVLGDHGMTKTGDHGGDSWDELHAALFVYSPSKLTTVDVHKNTFKEITQVDLVPTISLLLGIPIPYSNLGTVISDLNYHQLNDTTTGTLKSLYYFVEALRLNAHQVLNYIQSYAKFSELPVHMMTDFEQLFSKAEQQFQIAVTELDAGHSGDELFTKFLECKRMYTLCLTKIKKMCQDIWAKFDLPGMVLGVVLVSGAIVLNLYWFAVFRKASDDLYMSFLYGFLPTVLLVCFVGILSTGAFGLFYTVLGISLLTVTMASTVVYLSFKRLKENVKHIYNDIEYFPLILILLYFASLLSNSFVVHEDSLAAFLLVALIVHKTYCIISQLYVVSIKEKVHLMKRQVKIEHRQRFDIGRLLTSPPSIVLLLAICTCVFIRSSVIFRACREEQWECEPSLFLKSMSALSDDERKYNNIRYFGIVGVVLCLPGLTRSWLRSYGNLNGQDISVLCIKYIQPIGYVFLCLYWALQALPRKTFDNLPVWEIVIFPRLVYGCVGVTFLAVFVRPLCLYLVYRSNDESTARIFGSENVVPKMYHHIKENWRKHMHSSSQLSASTNGSSSKPSSPPMVYGLATVYSTSVLVLLSAVSLLLLMLLGDGLALSLITALAIMFCVLELHATDSTVCQNKVLDTPWASIMMYGLLASEHFFSTGHQAVVTTIQWQSAFHGFHGDFEYYSIPATLITLNTFASYILCTLGLPLLLFWPRFRGHFIYIFESSKQHSLDTKGEFILHEDQEELHRGLVHLLVGYVLFHGVKLLGAMGCALVNRRHLMVWKIFAPRFVFEGATFLVIGILCALIYFFVIRVDLALGKWVKKLEK